MESKERHGCVTAWLILMIIANSIIALTYLFTDNTTPQSPTNLTTLMLTTIGIANIIFAIMLLQWKKWAFWAFATTSLITLGVNISIGISVGNALVGLIGIVILYGILQIKKDGITAWENLE